MAARGSKSCWDDVPDNWREELGNKMLRECAGDTVFERGVAYFNDGRVTLARDGGGNATFKVKGTQTYSTELYFEDLGLHVDCNCPHGQEGHFCKHIVAAALLWRQHLGGEAPAPVANGPKPTERAAKAQQTKARKRGELRAFVEGQDSKRLSALLWQWADRETHLMAELKAWAASEQALQDPSQLNDAIDALLPPARGFLPYSPAAAYARRGEQVLPLLDQARECDAAAALAASEHALRRLYRTAAHADDSSGEVGGLLQSLVERIRLAVAAKPPPAAWAERLLGLIAADPYGVWAAEPVLDVGGHELRQRYSKLLDKRWQAIEEGKGKGDPKKETSWGSGGARTEADDERDRIRRLLIADLTHRQEHDAAVAFMARTARRDVEHLEVIRYCDERGRHREALALAEAAYKRDPKSFIFQDAVLKCWERDGWDEKAFALRKQRYWASLRLDEYQKMIDVAKAARQPLGELRAEVETMLLAREIAVAPAKRPSYGRVAGEAASGQRDVSLRAQWLLHEGRVDEALALVVKADHWCGDGVALALARRLDHKHDEQAFTLIDRVARNEIEHSTGRYDTALDLVRLAFERLNSKMKHAYTARLQTDYKAKRNFIKALDAL
jgi:hypothetical protein